LRVREEKSRFSPWAKRVDLVGDEAGATATLLVALSIDGRAWDVETRIVLARKRRRAIGRGECTEVPMAVEIETTAWLRATVEGETRFMTT